MINAIKSLFGLGPKVDYEQLIKDGALIVDVRTKGEYAGGHVMGSVNIPLDLLSYHLKKFKSKEQVIITCCASGMRSGSARRFLQSEGFTNVHNGGSWHNLNQYGKN